MGKDSPRRPEYCRDVKQMGHRHILEFGLENPFGSWNSLFETARLAPLCRPGISSTSEADVAIDLKKTQLGMSLENGPLTIRRHLDRHLAGPTQKELVMASRPSPRISALSWRLGSEHCAP